MTEWSLNEEIGIAQDWMMTKWSTRRTGWGDAMRDAGRDDAKAKRKRLSPEQREAEIVDTRREGKQIFYRLTEAKTAELIAALFDIYCAEDMPR